MTDTAGQARRAEVLVVDDAPENIDILVNTLKDEYKVRAATDGLSALALTHKHPPDIILLDVVMVPLDGYGVCRALRDDPLTRHIPVIFITSMNDVEDEKKGLDLGAVDYIAKPFSPPLVKARVRNHLALQDQRRALEQEVRARTRELETVNAALASEVLGRTQAMERAEYLFNFDALTGLPNRRQFVDRLERMLARAVADNKKLVLVGIGLDRFKVVKTVIGGTAAEQMLVQTAQRLQQQLQADDLLGRIGGEEFAMLVSLKDRAGEALALDPQELCGLLLSSLARDMELSSGKAKVRASAAYALFPEDANSAPHLMRHMESALEYVKCTGGSRAERFHRQMDNAAGATFLMEVRIREALVQHAFVPYYQPKLEAITGRVVGAEALIRWPIPGGGMISPGEFILVAERSGLISAIDRFMLREVCRQVAQWGGRFRGFRVAVNISASAFQSDSLVDAVLETLRQTGAHPQHLELEITEHALITDMSVVCAKLRALRDAGLRIALDDFGTGYSSMSYLQHLPLDTLKVDRAFVREIEANRTAGAIVRAIIAMARAMDLDVVAEGVETDAQLQFICEHGEDVIIQGGVYSAAVTAAEMEAIFARGVMVPPSGVRRQVDLERS